LNKSKYFKQLSEIRTLYRERIFAEIEKAYPLRISPYFYKWETVFTPIEKRAWHDIRILGLPLYPQIPVGKYFIDFGDPIKKIGVEVDGAAWHKDERRDNERQQAIENMGWEIWRIPGSACYRQDGDIATSEDILTELRDLHYPEGVIGVCTFPEAVRGLNV